MPYSRLVCGKTVLGSVCEKTVAATYPSYDVKSITLGVKMVVKNV